MTITIYQITADNRTINKLSSAGTGTTISTIDIPHDNNIMTPTFIVSANNALYTANYLHCPTYGRFYYIDSIVSQTGGRVALKCSVDVLQTYATAIKNCRATVIRTATGGKPTMYVDNKFPVYPSKKVVTSTTSVETSGSLNADGGYCYVLNTIGGTTNNP